MPQTLTTAPEMEWLDDPAYRIRNLTRLIRRMPNLYGRLHQLGLFRDEYSVLPYIEIEIERDSFSLIPVTPRGTPAPQVGRSTSELRVLKVERIALDGHINADTLRGRREIGSIDNPMHPMHELMKRMRRIAISHFQTKEFMYWGALKGDVISADGRKLYNSYEIMGEQPQTFEWNFSDTADPVDTKAREVDYFMEANLQGDTLSNVHYICGKAWFERLVTNKKIRDAYMFWASQNDPNRDGVRRVFSHAGVSFEVHNGQASFKKSDGTILTHKFVAENEAIGVPIGTNDTFVNYHGPSDWMSREDEPYDSQDEFGNWLYAKVKPDAGDYGLDVQTQQNLAPINLHPRLVTRHTMVG